MVQPTPSLPPPETQSREKMWLPQMKVNMKGSEVLRPAVGILLKDI